MNGINNIVKMNEADIGDNLTNSTLIDDDTPPKEVKSNKKNLKILKSSVNIMDRKSTDYVSLMKIKYILTQNDEDLIRNYKDKKYSKEDTKKYTKGLRNTLTRIVNEGQEIIERTYTPSQGNGRLYAKGGIQLLEHNIRNFIQQEGIKDYDMINAQPTILLFLTKKAGLPCLWLENYINNRTEILAESGLSKTEIISKLYQDKPTPSGNPRVDELIKEIHSNKKQLIKKYPQYINPDRETQSKNIISSTLCCIIGCVENEILNIALDAVGDTAKISTLIFDGFYAIGDISMEVLNNATKKYGIKWAIKPLTTCYELPVEFDGSSIQTYEEMKLKFESEVCYLTMLGKYKCKSKIDGIWNTMSKAEIQDKYINWKSTDPESGKTCKFFDRWLEDPKRVDYERMVFKPYSMEKHNNTHELEFNIFTGFRFNEDKDIIKDEEVQWFRDFINKVYCSAEENDALLNWLLDYIAHRLQRPDKKLSYILVFKGYEGTGKDTIKEMFSRLYGKEFIFECEGIEEVVAPAWNDHLVNKLHLVMNEVSASDGIKYMEKLKHKTTTPDFNIHERFTKQQTCPDLNQSQINSNGQNPVIVSATDRRFIIIEMNEDLVGDKLFWDTTYENLDNDEMMHKVYNWLLQKNINSNLYDENKRPITEEMKRMASKSIGEPLLVLYHNLTKWIKQDKGEWFMKASEFNSKCQYVSNYVLDKKTINKRTIGDLMARIPERYIILKSKKVDGSSPNCYIVKDPQRLIDRIKKLDFKYFDIENFDWESMDGGLDDYDCD